MVLARIQFSFIYLTALNSGPILVGLASIWKPQDISNFKIVGAGLEGTNKQKIKL